MAERLTGKCIADAMPRYCAITASTACLGSVADTSCRCGLQCTLPEFRITMFATSVQRPHAWREKAARISLEG